jgi:hypothetical protein
MTETAMVIIPLIIGGFAVVLTCAIGCCCCCCAMPLWRLFFPAGYNKVQQQDSQNAALARSNQEYFEMDQDVALIPIVEAYVVPPLISRGEATARVLTEQSSNHVNNSARGGGFKDIWAAVLFLINVVIVFSLAIDSYAKYKDVVRVSDPSAEFNTNVFSAFAFFIFFMVIISSSVCSFALYILVSNAARIIDWVNWMNIIGCGAMTLFSLVTLQIFMAIVFAVLTLISVWYYWSIQSRIPFASAVIGAACGAIRQNFIGLVTTAYSGLIFQLLWILLWTVAMYGIVNSYNGSNDGNHHDDANGGLSGFVYFLMVLSMYWGVQVVHYIVSVTAGGTVATWWFQPHHPAPVRGSLFRATTTSFGSICFGALIVAFIQTLRELLRTIRKQNHRRRERDAFADCLVCIADAMLRCVEDALVYINRFAYSYVAAYGYDFISAGKQVTNLFQRRGWDAIINDNLISNVFSIFSVGMAVISALFGAFLLPTVYVTGGLAVTGNTVVAGVIVGFLVGLVVGLVMISCLDSAVAMVFVCFAEDPDMLRVNHLTIYENLKQSWELFNPSTLLWTTAVIVEDGYGSQPIPQATVVSNPIHPIDSYQAPRNNPPPFNPNFAGGPNASSSYYKSNY